MAARQNQGLQIALIFFVITTILLAVVVYFSVTSANDASAKLKAEQDRVKATNTQRDTYKAYYELLETWVGTGALTDEAITQNMSSLDADADLKKRADAVKALYDQEMLNFSGADAPKGWKDVTARLVTVIDGLNNTITNLNAEVARTTQQRDTDVAAAKEAQKTAEVARDTAVVELQKVKDEFAATVTKLNAELATAQANVNDIGQKHQALQQTSTAELAVRDDKIVALEKNVVVLADENRQLKRTEPDVYDGRITKVNADLGVVFINLGSSDNLTPGLSFSVYGKDELTSNTKAKKAEIRIRRVIDAKTAEATIINSSLQNPILVDDKLFTPTWDPRKTTKFVLAGFIDLNGDGKTDSVEYERVKSLISQSGGEVICYVDPDSGDISGDFDATTDFVVTGEESLEGDKAIVENIVRSNKTIAEKAKEAGVKSIGYREMLNQMGASDETSARKVGSGGEFQERRPPARSGDSAF